MTSPWAQIDKMVARYQRDLQKVREAAKPTSHVRVRLAPSGVWSARRAAAMDGGPLELYERSADALIAAMELAARDHKRKPRLPKAPKAVTP
jgi:hypothetical protein